MPDMPYRFTYQPGSLTAMCAGDHLLLTDLPITDQAVNEVFSALVETSAIDPIFARPALTGYRYVLVSTAPELQISKRGYLPVFISDECVSTDRDFEVLTGTGSWSVGDPGPGVNLPIGFGVFLADAIGSAPVPAPPDLAPVSLVEPPVSGPVLIESFNWEPVSDTIMSGASAPVWQPPVDSAAPAFEPNIGLPPEPVFDQLFDVPPDPTPEVSGLEASGGPDVVTPGFADPDVADPDAAAPAGYRPNVVQPDAATPSFATPDVAVPDAYLPSFSTPDAATPVTPFGPTPESTPDLAPRFAQTATPSPEIGAQPESASPVQQTPTPAQPEIPAPAEEEYERTVNRNALPTPQLTGPIVTAVSCTNGHLTPPYSGQCRVCRQPIPPQQPFSTPRPMLGVLQFPNGAVLPLASSVIMGRRPQLPADIQADPQGNLPQLIPLHDPDRDVSNQHLEIRLDYWHVLAVDLGSTNGTWVTLPGQDPVQLRPHDPLIIEPGTIIDLAQALPMRFEAV